MKLWRRLCGLLCKRAKIKWEKRAGMASVSPVLFDNNVKDVDKKQGEKRLKKGD